MNTKKEKLLYDTYQSFIDQCLGRIKPDSLSEILSEEAMGFGTTADEKIFGVEEFHKLLLIQKEQSEGLEMDWALEPVSRYVNSNENLAAFAEDLHLMVAVNGEKIKMYLRISIIMEYKNDKWIIIHWHGSKPENVQSEEDTFGIESWKQKVDELEKLVAERTADLVEKNRELEIEMTLERVRARTMSMQHSKELADTASILFQQIKGLGFETWSCGFCTWQEKDIVEVWMGADSGELLPPMLIPYKKEASHNDIYKASLTGAQSHEKIWEGKALNKHYDFLRTLPSVAIAIKQLEDAGLSLPTKQCYYVGFFKQGYLLLITKEPIAEMRDISKRFAKVFEQAYTRFLDLQKAEAQAREAMIEAALEKVRSRTMAMQKSDELAEAAALLFQQVRKLGIETYTSGFNIWNEENNTLDSWMSNPTGIMNPPFIMPLNEYGQHKRFYEAWKNNTQFLEDDLTGKKIINHYKYLRSFPLMEKAFATSEKAGIKTPDRQVHNAVFFSYGYVLFVTLEPNPQNQDVFKRFGKVFEQTYTRFLDLQKAEAQTREAEIELALERVRARTMAMQHSDELADASLLLDQQIRGLGIKTRGCAFNIYGEKESTEWFSNEMGTMQTYKTPREKVFLDYYQAGQKGETLLIKEFSGKECIDWYNYLCTLPGIGDGLKQMIASGGSFPTRQIDHVSFFKYGYLLFLTFEPVPEFHEIFKRFAKVFEQTYTRFLDLQKAETQARESQIQLALERVRARTMAMQKSDELSDAVYILFQQFKELGENPDQATIGVINENEKVIEYWVTMHGNAINKVFKFPIDEPNVTNKIYKAWKANKKSLVIDLSGSALREFMTYRAGKGGAAINPKEKRRIINVAFFSKGLLNVQSNEERSEESIKLLERFAAVFEQTYTRFLDLQKSEAQARESQIQLALERLRARTMAMQHSNELLDAATLLFQQIKSLGTSAWNCSFNIWTEDKKQAIAWNATKEGFGRPFNSPSNQDVFQRFYEASLKGEELYVEAISGDALKHHYDYLSTLPGVGETLAELKAAGVALPTFQIFNIAYFTQGYLMFITYEPVPELWDIFKRFAKVFEQTYTRFLDLQKAEAQAREAHIEAALEKVRSRSMGMQKSDELKEVIQVVYDQFVHLNINTEHAGFVIDYKLREDRLIWVASKYGLPSQLTIPYFDSVYYNSFNEAKEKGWDFFATNLGFEEKNNFYRQLFVHIPGLPEEDREFYFNCPGLAISTVLLENIGLYIENFEGIPYSDEDNAILMRFGKVFQQTYTRFLDLQKAEAQAREAQIETALEKVRSRSLAMHKSDEIIEVSKSVFEKLDELNIELNTAFIIIFKEGSRDSEWWLVNRNDQQYSSIFVKYIDILTLREQFEAKEKGKELFSKTYYGEEKKELFRYLFTQTDFKYAPPARQKFIFETDAVSISMAFTNKIAIQITRHTNKSFSNDENEIVKRFTKVFDQSFTRFLDLKKAEAQAREAQIETGLEKVRSRTLAMQKSDELADTSIVIFKQLINLGIEPNRLFIGIINEKTHSIEAWATNEDGTKIGNHFTLNTGKNQSVKKMYEGWKQKKTSITIDMTGEELQNYFHYLSDEMRIPFKGGLSQKRRIQTIAYFGQGLIGMASPDEQPEATTQLLERFAAVFNLTYTRFNDLKIAEAHAIKAEEDLIKLQTEKRRAEEALTNLKAAQSQLVQSEKMASLGELTAGIAHEIQNPLNFVNNFSEVSKELIDEMKEEMDKGNLEDVKEIMKDVIQNLEKINHHGRRADAIVKGMLQHSQSSTGKKEPTDINALCDEYLRLSYHGLRAKDKSFNATLKTDFEESIGKINIIPQDIGRVVLNLINNAFYACTERLTLSEAEVSRSAVDEKRKSGVGNYEPMVSISTKKLNDKVQIIVKDNGNGIPQNILDKIFQPFFTTKPTGQGTGLGLSLSYDIVKAHSGEMKVESKVNEGSKFIIQLPFA